MSSCFFNEIFYERFQRPNELDEIKFCHVQLTKFNDQHANHFHLPCSLKIIQLIAPGSLRLAWTEIQAKNSKLELKTYGMIQGEIIMIMKPTGS